MPRAKPNWQSNFPPRSPATNWNAWFASVVFREGPFRWLHTLAYRPADRFTGHPIASLEGLGERPETAWMVSLGGVQSPVHVAGDAPLTALASGVTSGEAAWNWSHDALTVGGTLLGRPTRLTATLLAPQVLPWLKVTGLLEYRGLAAGFELAWGDERWQGAGLVDHAWGGHLPVPAHTLLPGAWQWDVLWDEGEPRCLHTALTARWLGLGFSPKAFRDEGGRVRAVRTTPVDVEVEDNGLPTVWRGSIGGRGYRAERDGKALVPFKGGAYFGFTYTMGDRKGVGFSRVLRHGGKPGGLGATVLQPGLSNG
jgi:hypothetical protein